MRKILKVSIILCVSCIILGSASSCKTKEGCGLEEKYNNPDMEKSKRSEPTLWSKKQKKRMKKG